MSLYNRFKGIVKAKGKSVPMALTDILCSIFNFSAVTEDIYIIADDEATELL